MKIKINSYFKLVNLLIKRIHSSSEEENLPIYISRKAGKKCCPWGQDGKPLQKQEVLEFINTINSNNLVTLHSNENFTKINTCFYYENVDKSVDFVKEVYEIDKRINTNQIPNFFLINQNLIIIEFYTNMLKGLSRRDLQLIGVLSNLNFKLFNIHPLKSNFYDNEFKSKLRKEIRILKLN